MRRTNGTCLLLTVLTLLWMLLIFHMSSAVKDESNAQSGVICEFLCEMLVEGYEDIPPAQQLQLQERFSFPVRKGAHLTEYTVLGILLTMTAASYMTPTSRMTPCMTSCADQSDMTMAPRMTSCSDGSPSVNLAGASKGKDGRPDNVILSRLVKTPAFPAFIIGFLYAVSDEIHQHFVPGRAMQARDVLIDSAGVLLGICIVRVMIQIRNRER